MDDERQEVLRCVRLDGAREPVHVGSHAQCREFIRNELAHEPPQSLLVFELDSDVAISVRPGGIKRTWTLADYVEE